MNPKKERISVQTSVKADINKVWEFWTNPEHIVKWNFASDDWCCPSAVNNLQVDEKFNWRMESKDGKVGFNFKGIYDEIIDQKSISYKMSDGRSVDINFSEKGDNVIVSETFDAEGSNSDEMQRAGWQGACRRWIDNRSLGAVAIVRLWRSGRSARFRRCAAYPAQIRPPGRSRRRRAGPPVPDGGGTAPGNSNSIGRSFLTSSSPQNEAQALSK